MRKAILAAGLLLTGACGDSPTAKPTVRVVGLEALKAELPRVLGKGALVNVWAMW